MTGRVNARRERGRKASASGGRPRGGASPKYPLNDGDDAVMRCGVLYVGALGGSGCGKRRASSGLFCVDAHLVRYFC